MFINYRLQAYPPNLGPIHFSCIFQHIQIFSRNTFKQNKVIDFRQKPNSNNQTLTLGVNREFTQWQVNHYFDTRKSRVTRGKRAVSCDITFISCLSHICNQIFQNISDIISQCPAHDTRCPNILHIFLAIKRKKFLETLFIQCSLCILDC